jgi:hypothetical protein
MIDCENRGTFLEQSYGSRQSVLATVQFSFTATT